MASAVYVGGLSEFARVGLSLSVLPVGNFGVSRVISPEYTRLLANYAAPFAPIVESTAALRRHWMNRFAEQLTPSLSGVFEKMLPANWRGVQNLWMTEAKSIALDEGIPLMWVPRSEIVQRLVDANDARARRNIVSRRWVDISVDCEETLGSLSCRQIAADVSLALQAAVALRDGHMAAAQALSTNVLDSVLHKHFAKKDRIDITSHSNGKQLDVDVLPVRVGLTLAPVWRGYETYWPDKGDKIPYRYTRHATAHGASRRQYSRINAAISLMLVSSVLRLLDEYLPR